jgi:ABC-type glutathione transport system ATPase component
MVFQDPIGSLNPRLKAGAAIAEVLRVHGRAPGRAAAAAQAVAWLETLGLPCVDRVTSMARGAPPERATRESTFALASQSLG